MMVGEIARLELALGVLTARYARVAARLTLLYKSTLCIESETFEQAQRVPNGKQFCESMAK